MTKDNFKKIFSTFDRNYVPIPLEVFGENPYKTLVSTLLSSRTKDEVTLKSSKRLFEEAPNINRLGKLSQTKIQKLIYPVGFYKSKARHLAKLADMVIQNHRGKIPNTKEELMKLPGVGRKTANLVLNRAFRIPAIAVDTHVHKISNLLSWVKTKSPEKTEVELIKLLHKTYWSDTNSLFVSIGRQFNTQKKLLSFLKRKKLINTP